ncbi:MAG: HEPN domain-containing protein [Prochlorotrichaceae cyanobacterium]|jgi:HEPN domain-containing protein
MLPEEISSSVQRWMKYAQSDLDLARINAPNTVLPETLCFHAQQAVEKALKALLQYYSIPIPRTHSIAFLLDLLQSKIAIPLSIQDSVILTDYAVETRYPGIYEPITDTEYQEAIHLAETIVSWVDGIIKSSSNI